MPSNTDNSGSARTTRLRRAAAAGGPTPAVRPNLGSQALDAQLGKAECCPTVSTINRNPQSVMLQRLDLSVVDSDAKEPVLEEPVVEPVVELLVELMEEAIVEPVEEPIVVQTAPPETDIPTLEVVSSTSTEPVQPPAPDMPESSDLPAPPV